VPTALAVAAALAGPLTPAQATPSSSGADELNARTGYTATFARQPRSGRLSFFGTRPGHPAERPSDIGAKDTPAVAASRWAARYGNLYGVADPSRDLTVLRQSRAGTGWSVALQQQLQGLPVVGGVLVVTLDPTNRLVGLNGAALPLAEAPAAARLTGADAARLAVRKVERTVRAAHLSASTPSLAVLDLGLLGGPSLGGAATVWSTTVSSAGSEIRHQVYVDAARGTVRLDLDLNSNARSRVVCNAANVPDVDVTCPGTDLTPVASEDSPAAAPADGGDTDTYNAFRFSGAVYDFYSTILGRDGIDGAGGPLASTVHWCPSGSCPSFPNAFWTGSGMVYGDGFASALDVVGHEMTHGVTERTSNLFPYYQSGAINESISDVMGELIQQIEGPALNAPGQTDVYDPAQAWTVGEKLPVPFTRSMADPTSDSPSDPDSMQSSHYSALTPDDASFDSGGVHANAGVNNKAAYLMAAGGTLNGQTVTGLSGADQVEKDVKLANVYYQLESLMTPGSSYADLARLLPQSCDLVSSRGTTLPLPGGGTTGVTAEDCAQVTAAVTATQMALQPTSAQAAVPAQAPWCTNGGAQSISRLDAFDAANPIPGSYARGSAGLDGYGLKSFGQWWWSKQAITDYGPAAYLPPYSTSGTGALWGDDADPTTFDPDYQTYDRQDSFIRTGNIAARVGTFVRFNQAWEFEYYSDGTPYYADGGRVEYSVDNGAHWADAQPLIVNGGYNGTVTKGDNYWFPGYVDPNPLKGARGYVGSSHGWTSSRIDLSSLNGKAVQLRWRIGGDDSGGSLGWYLDDIATYSCNPTTVTLSAPSALTYGGTGYLTAHLVRSGTTTPVAGKGVQLWQRLHGTTTWTAVGTPHVTNSSGNAAWSIKPATNEDYQVRFLGSTPYAPSNYALRYVPVRVSLSRSPSSTAFTLGHAFTTSGVVAPKHVNTLISLQRYYSGGWHTVANTRLNSLSRYAVAYKPTTRGTYTFRTVFAGDSDHVATGSASFTVKVS
jgi:Zn-dependent metalloprotease